MLRRKVRAEAAAAESLRRFAGADGQAALVSVVRLFFRYAVLKKYRAHALQGDKLGIVSLSLDYAYRMEVQVKVEKVEGQDVITILEVSNHYGD